MSTLESILDTRRVVVVVGSGGVGKTTSSALFALHAAIGGKRVLVMTIDPARRLANALGVDGLGHEIERIDLNLFREFDVEPKGELWATMLDMKSAFDSIIERHVKSDQEREQIYNNRFYHFFSTSLAGAQELSATDRLLDVVRSGKFDLVVLDTPPTTNALDFLDAPKRFADALDNDTIRWFIHAGRRAVKATNLVNVGAGMVTRTLGKFTGIDFFRELGEFLYHLNNVLVGFHDRAQETQDILMGDDAAFVIVTSPDPATVREAQFFRQKLNEYDAKFGAIIVNRVRQLLPAEPSLQEDPKVLHQALMQLAPSELYGSSLTERLAEKLSKNACDFNGLAKMDARTIETLSKEFGSGVALNQVPLYAHDIHSLQGLERVRRDLFGLTPLDDILAPSYLED